MPEGASPSSVGPLGPPAVAVVGGVAGPAGFVAAWAVGGAVAGGYSPVEDAISRLAAVGASTRPLMTAGFLAFGAGVGAFAVLGLRRAVPGPSWVAALGAAVATVGVAATPLDGGVDGLHGALAALGYGALVAVPALAAAPLAGAGRRRAAAVAAATALGGALLLGASVAVEGESGLLQRAGLTVLDAWLAGTALRLARQRRCPVPA